MKFLADICLELDSNVFLVKPIGKYNEKDAIMLISDHSIILIDGSNSELIKRIDSPSINGRVIVECAYDSNSRNFWIVMSDATIVIAPDSCVNTSMFQAVSWPIQPKMIQILSGQRGVVVENIDGSLCRVMLNENSIECPIPSAISTVSNPARSIYTTFGRDEWLGIIYQGSNTPLTSTRKSTSSAKPFKSFAINAIQLPTIAQGKAAWLTNLSSETDLLCFETIDAASTEELTVVAYGMCLSSNAAYLMVSATSKPSKKSSAVGASSSCWVKVNVNGTKLFERKLDATPRAAASTKNGFLCIIHDSEMKIWDERFGVPVMALGFELASAGVNLSTAWNLGKVSSALFETDSSENQFILYICNQTVLYKAKMLITSGDSSTSSEDAFAVSTSTANNKSLQSNALINMIGRLSGTRSISASPAAPSSSSSSGNSSGSNSQRSILKQCSVEAQTALSNLRSNIDKLNGNTDMTPRAEESVNAATEAITTAVDTTPKQKTKKRKLLALEIIGSASAHAHEFLNLFKLAIGSCDSETSSCINHSEDWEVLISTIISGLFSVRNNKEIVNFCATLRRLDVLCCIAQYAVDLTEQDAVQLLIMFFSLSASDVKQWSLCSGIVISAAAAALLSISSISNENPSKRSKKSKKSTDDDGKNDVQTSENIAQTRLDLLNHVVTCLLRRKDGFSSVVLTEVLANTLSPQAAAMLIRILSIRLNGVCNNITLPDVTKAHIHDWKLISSDLQMRKLIVWIESLLDSHFSAIAVNASHHISTRLGLVAALEAVPTKALESSIDSLESVVGLWAHISRMNQSKKTKLGSGAAVGGANNALSIYTVDKLSL